MITEKYGTVCTNCSKGRKDEPVKTASSIHGSCLECGFQKFPSRYRHSKVWKVR